MWTKFLITKFWKEIKHPSYILLITNYERKILNLMSGWQRYWKKIFFQHLSTRFKSLKAATFPFLNILEYDILSNIYIAISELKFMKTFPDIVGNPVQIDEEFYKNLQAALKYCLVTTM